MRQDPTERNRRSLSARVPAPSRLARFASGALPVLATSLLAMSGPAAGQDAPGGIEGRVVDAVRNAPLAVARVAVPSLGRESLTDGEGRFHLDGLPPGEYTLRVEYLGFETTVREVTVEPGGETRLEIVVSPRPVPLEDLEVTTLSLTWFPGFLERRERLEGHFFTHREIVSSGARDLTHLLEGREGVRIGVNSEASGRNRYYPQLYDTGPAYERAAARRDGPLFQPPYCRPMVFVDGDRMGPGARYWHLNEIPPGRVLAMEVYHDAGEIPEDIPFTDLRAASLDDDAVGMAREVGGRQALGRGVGGSAGSDVRHVLRGTALEEGFRWPVPRGREEAGRTGQRSVYLGLYERLPRLEHCGAVFVWTEFYPLREG